MGNSKWNSDKIVSLSAIFISLLTLGVFVYQTNLIRKQQHMSVYPFLGYGVGGAGTGNNKLIMNNTGIGPALIKKIDIQYKDKKFNYIYELANYFSEQDSSLQMQYSDITEGMLISINDSKVLMATHNDLEDKLYNLLTDDFDLIVEYESVYGDRWKVTSKDQPGFGMPVKID